MSPLFIIFALLGIGVLFSQLGGKVAARSAPAWWLVFAFLIFCVVTPNSLRPISEFLGIQVVSNFVLAALIFFLFFQAIQESVFATQHSRKLREMISTTAAQSFHFEKKSNVLVVLPTYNEEKNLHRMIERLSNASSGSFDFCFVNDGSFDATEEILKNKKAPYVSHAANIGVSGALLTGFKIAKLQGYEYVVQCDADGQHPIQKIPELVTIARTEASDLVIGSRFLASAHEDESTTGLRRFGSWIIRITLKLFSQKQSMTDPTSGFRIYSQGVLPMLIREMPEEYPEPEILALLLLKGKKITESAVVMNAREGGVSSISGLKTIHFMMKVLSALVGLRLRNL